MKICVYGTGYLGATHAACMAELGHEVLGIDIDQAKVSELAAGRLPFFEPGLESMLRRHVEGGSLRFSSSYIEAAAFGEIHFIGVGTPQRKGELGADTGAVFSVVTELVPMLTRSSVIVGKSTVPVGTACQLQEHADSLAVSGISPEIIWNPEFLREGYAIEDTLHPDRIVIGAAEPDSEGARLLEIVYERIIRDGCPVIHSNLETAELVKVSANAFLATKISFINAVSEICEVSGADVTVLADAIGMDERIGRKFLNAGLGFGGGCLPKDIRAFMARAGELGADQAMAFLREVDVVNMRRREKFVDLAVSVCGGAVVGKNIAVLGAAFKPNSDDVRDSPALSVAGSLSLKGGQVSVYDPQATKNAQKVFPTLSYASSIAGACAAADVVIVATEWPEFIDLNPSDLAGLVRSRIVLDGRNCLDRAQWVAAGWEYRALGRASS
ncbi:UDP-glucose 6-dehydrogenase [Dietzia alimentaria]|uniref:UDP-glucose dehydrogenase family protein n=1 Tax=Dietzia kunjamensis TaxID=322509 RepID=UPI0008487B98|nr:UDP-glucose/GDP-mannose dehydrogenase family protein [Dietzia kunjamensis]MDJ0422758.1 UDP-glucose/GDP-mannose dehydrogenase family protein [Dietzia kunjamensis]ODQ84374.1 UDP-glucose 6-dehydrogenase [Dietzia alimentaria]